MQGLEQNYFSLKRKNLESIIIRSITTHLLMKCQWHRCWKYLPLSKSDEIFDNLTISNWNKTKQPIILKSNFFSNSLFGLKQ